MRCLINAASLAQAAIIRGVLLQFSPLIAFSVHMLLGGRCFHKNRRRMGEQADISNTTGRDNGRQAPNYFHNKRMMVETMAVLLSGT
jgi:hypothetical protein